jgi:hypothetical protein
MNMRILKVVSLSFGSKFNVFQMLFYLLLMSCVRKFFTIFEFSLKGDDFPFEFQIDPE